MKMVAPHHCKGVSYSLKYLVHKFQGPSSTLSELSRYLRTIMPPQVILLASWLISSQKCTRMTIVGVWWHLIAAEEFHTA